jgi:hypothetical protein
MKKLKNLLVLMMAVMAVVMVSSCGGDDNDIEVAGGAKAVAGNYVSTLNCEVTYGGQKVPFSYENVAVTIVAKDESTIDINVSSYSDEKRGAIEAIEIKDVKVADENGSYTIVPKEFNGSTASGKAYSGTLKGSYAAGKLSLAYSLQYGVMPMPMQNTYEAQKSAE